MTELKSFIEGAITTIGDQAESTAQAQNQTLGQLRSRVDPQQLSRWRSTMNPGQQPPGEHDIGTPPQAPPIPNAAGPNPHDAINETRAAPSVPLASGRPRENDPRLAATSWRDPTQISWGPENQNRIHRPSDRENRTRPMTLPPPATPIGEPGPPGQRGVQSLNQGQTGSQNQNLDPDRRNSNDLPRRGYTSIMENFWNDDPGSDDEANWRGASSPNGSFPDPVYVTAV